METEAVLLDSAHEGKTPLPPRVQSVDPGFHGFPCL